MCWGYVIRQDIAKMVVKSMDYNTNGSNISKEQNVGKIKAENHYARYTHLKNSS